VKLEAVEDEPREGAETFQMLMVASFEPPPDARIEVSQGHHAIAWREGF